MDNESKEVKAHETAHLIKIANTFLSQLDIEFIEQSAKETMEQADWQETIIVLNPGFNQSKTDLLREQGIALKHLSNYIKSLKECDNIRTKINDGDTLQEQINALFL